MPRFLPFLRPQPCAQCRKGAVYARCQECGLPVHSKGAQGTCLDSQLAGAHGGTQRSDYFRWLRWLPTALGVPLIAGFACMIICGNCRLHQASAQQLPTELALRTNLLPPEGDA